MLDIIIVYIIFGCFIFKSPLGFLDIIIIILIDLIGCKERLIVPICPSIFCSIRNPIFRRTKVIVICRIGIV